MPKDVVSILDVGSSVGKISNGLRKKKSKLKIQGVDVYLPFQALIPVKIYDGKTLPFKDNSFDCVLIVDVLHHTKNILQLLKECKRVSKKCIIIKDHYYENRFDLFILKLFDYVGNYGYSIKLVYNFLRLRQWLKLFDELNLYVLKSKKFKFNKLDISKNIVFLLEVS